MAQNEFTVHVQIKAISGLATCGVCGTLVSFEIEREQFATQARIECPRCKGTARLHEGTVVPVIEITSPARGGLE